MQNRMMLTLFYLVLIAGSQKPAYGYVDPGLIGLLWQLGYVLIFGLITAAVLNPWQYLKAWFRKIFGKPSDEKDGASSDEETGMSSDAEVSDSTPERRSEDT